MALQLVVKPNVPDAVQVTPPFVLIAPVFEPLATATHVPTDPFAPYATADQVELAGNAPPAFHPEPVVLYIVDVPALAIATKLPPAPCPL